MGKKATFFQLGIHRRSAPVILGKKALLLILLFIPPGHYLSDVYDMKKKGWFSFDDSHVTRIPESEVRTKRERSGYIFFYMSK